MPRRYPPLTLAEIQAILTCWGFTPTHRLTGSSHVQWEKVHRGRLYAVTVDGAIDDFDEFLVKSLLSQSGLSREQFYAGCRSSARKINVDPLKHAR